MFRKHLNYLLLNIFLYKGLTMSSLLEQAIIDAKALKDAALKNAEQMVIEKYSEQIKDAVTTLLEQEEDEMGMEPDFGNSDDSGENKTTADESDEELSDELSSSESGQVESALLMLFKQTKLITMT